jgi:hypothetical protein
MSCSNSCAAGLVMLSTALSDVVTRNTRVFGAQPPVSRSRSVDLMPRKAPDVGGVAGQYQAEHNNGSGHTESDRLIRASGRANLRWL